MNVFRDLFNSKKFVGAILTMLSAVAIRLGIPEVQLEEIIAMVSPMLAYIGAQGFADKGKSVALLNQQDPS